MPVTRLLLFIQIVIGVGLLSVHTSADQVDQYFTEGLNRLRSEDYVSAKSAFLKAIDSGNSNLDVLAKSNFHLAKICFQLKEYEEADKYAQQSMVYFKDTPLNLARAYQLLGKINFYQKDYKAAEQAFILNLHHHPKPIAKHYMFLAKTFIKSKKLSEAIDTLDQGIAQFGDLQEFHDKALSLEIKLYRYQDATSRIEYLISNGKRPIHNHIKLGELYHHRGENHLAQKHFQIAKKLFNNLPASKKDTKYMKSLRSLIKSRAELAIN